MIPASTKYTASVALFLPSLEGGGTERVFVELANAFAAANLRTDLVLARAHGPYLAELSASVRVIDLRSRGVLRALPRLARYLRSERPLALLSGLDHANIVAVLASFLSRARTRCVVSMRSVPTTVYREAGAERSWMVLQLIRVAYRFADAIIANSNFVAADLCRFLRIPRGRVSVIYNPVNTQVIERLSRETASHPWSAPDASPVILGVGSLRVLKDFPTLIRAFAIVRKQRDSRLVILGEGPDRPQLERLLRELALEHDVYLPGFVRNPFAWMRRARVFVSSSLTEGCPNALMQALACGIPVVSTNCAGGSAEILENGKWGRLVAVADPNAMAEAIMFTLDATVRPDAHLRMHDFVPTEIARQYLDVLLPTGQLRAARV